MGFLGWALRKTANRLADREYRNKIVQSGVLQDPYVRRFFENTYIAWSQGLMGPDFAAEANRHGIDDLIIAYSPTMNPEIDALFRYFKPDSNEFLVGQGDNWFLLTNIRLLLRDTSVNQWKPVTMNTVSSIQTHDSSAGATLVFNLYTGHSIEFNYVEIYPRAEFLEHVINNEFWNWQRPGAAPTHCDTCGQPVKWEEGYQSYYCSHCNKTI